MSSLFGHKRQPATILQFPVKFEEKVLPPETPILLAHNRAMIGTHEILNGHTNPILEKFFSHTSLHTKENLAWCAAYMCWLLETNGFKSPHSASAVHFAKYGNPSHLAPGMIVVVKHLHGVLAGHYHVTMVDSVNEDGSFQGTGGNQNNMVCTERFSKESFEFTAIRAPIAA